MRRILTFLPAIALLLSGMAHDASASLKFYANLNGNQVVPATASSATGFATFSLNAAQTELTYSLNLFGVNLEANPANRINGNDVTKIHIHVGPRGTNGPHTLNIFGLPSEDDDDLVVNFAANSLTGVWDDGDFTGTGAGNTRKLSNFLDELKNGDLYIQVHALDDSNYTIRGQIVPEPGAMMVWSVLGLAGAGFVGRRRRR